MTVVLMTQCFPPETHAGANRMIAFAEALATRADTAVVTIEPSYPSPEYHRHTRWGEDDRRRSFRVVRVGSFHPHQGSYLVRGLRESWMAARLAAKVAAQRPSIVVASSPSLFIGVFGMLAARLRRARFVWDIRDLTWEYLSDERGRGVVPSARRALGRALEALARFVLRASDGITVSNSGLRTAVCDLVPRCHSTHVAPNGIATDLLERALQTSDVPDPGTPRVTYAGAIGYYQGLDVLLDVAELLPEVEVRLVGDGPMRSNLESEAAKRGLENVTFTGYVSRDRLFTLYDESTLLFGSLKDIPSMESVTLPSKLFEYMATGRPVVYAGGGIAAALVAESGVGLVSDPPDASTIRGAVERLLDDHELWRTMAEAGRMEARRHRRESIMEEAAAFVLATE